MNNNTFLPIVINNPRDQKKPESQLPEDKTVLRKRVYSFTTDLFFIALINKGLMYTYINFLKTYFYQLTTKTQMILELKMNDIFSVSLIIVFWGYFLMSYYWGEGKTPGKILFGLKVYSPKFKETGEYHLNFKESFARTMGYFICYLTGGALFAISFLTKNSKGIPDWLSQTSIITNQQMDYINNVYFGHDSKEYFIQPAATATGDEIQLSLFDQVQVNELQSDGTVIELPAPQKSTDNDDSEAA